MSVDSYYKKNMAAFDESMKKSIADSNAIFANQKQNVTNTYNSSIELSKQEYDEDLRANEVQKYINEREVAENNANLGLTDSGLNRTQMTAVQLSASNNAAKIERDRTNMVNALTIEMNTKLAEIENDRISAEASIRSGYEKQAMDAAVDSYEANVAAETERTKAAMNVSVKRLEEIGDEIKEIKEAAAKGRKNADGTLKKGYNVKKTANDKIADRLNELVLLGVITEEQATNLYKNSAFKNV